MFIRYFIGFKQIDKKLTTIKIIKIMFIFIIRKKKIITKQTVRTHINISKRVNQSIIKRLHQYHIMVFIFK